MGGEIWRMEERDFLVSYLIRKSEHWTILFSEYRWKAFCQRVQPTDQQMQERSGTWSALIGSEGNAGHVEELIILLTRLSSITPLVCPYILVLEELMKERPMRTML
jgi:hypothetical protein